MLTVRYILIFGIHLMLHTRIPDACYCTLLFLVHVASGSFLPPTKKELLAMDRRLNILKNFRELSMAQLVLDIRRYLGHSRQRRGNGLRIGGVVCVYNSSVQNQPARVRLRSSQYFAAEDARADSG